jgi:hypothetical protein
MTPPRPARLFLDTDGQALLEQQLSADEQHVLRALAELDPSSPICCLGLLYVSDDETPSVSYIYAWTSEARDTAFADDPQGALAHLWSPADWDCDLDDLVAPPDPTEETERLAEALRAAGCDDLPGSYLMDLAHRLNRVTLSVPTTPDFACWATEHDEDERWLWMTEVARPEVVATYRSNGWLREPEDDRLLGL